MDTMQLKSGDADLLATAIVHEIRNTAQIRDSLLEMGCGTAETEDRIARLRDILERVLEH